MANKTYPKRFATQAEQPLPHTQDTDCTLDDHGLCVYCGAHHGEPCVHCGGKGFHTPGCLTRHELWTAIQNGERVAWFVIATHRNPEGKHIGLLAHENHPGFYITDLLLDADLGIAQLQCDEHNAHLGVTTGESMVVVLSTFSK